MSRTVNKVILIGHVGAKPIKRFTASEVAVANFDIATNDEWTDKATGEKKKKTEWHKIVAWRKLAEICEHYLDKGRMVYIEGKLQTNKWADSNGNTRYTTEIVADQINFLNKPQNQQQQDYKEDYEPVGEDIIDDEAHYGPEDDVPF